MVRKYFCVLVAAVWTLVMFLVVCGAMLSSLNASASLWWVQHWWSPVLLWAGGAKMTVTGLENVDPTRPTIYVSNHQSTLDIPVLFCAIPIDFRFVAKKQLKYVPVLGWYLSLARYIFIDRGNHKEAVKSLDEAARKIREGISIVVFPEGTRSDDRRVLPFKKGPFALAVKAQVPVCPVTIEGSGTLMPKNSWNIVPGPVRVHIGTPIDPVPFGDKREALARAVREQVIVQSLQLGGLGGDVSDAIAARGKEGIGRGQDDGAQA